MKLTRLYELWTFSPQTLCINTLMALKTLNSNGNVLSFSQSQILQRQCGQKRYTKAKYIANA